MPRSFYHNKANLHPIGSLIFPRTIQSNPFRSEIISLNQTAAESLLLRQDGVYVT